MDKFKIINQAIEVFGKEHQIVKALEEMSELAKELTKDLGGYTVDRNHIAEEIADVLVMIDQLMIIYDCDKTRQFYREVYAIQDKKIERLQDMIEKEMKNREFLDTTFMNTATKN